MKRRSLFLFLPAFLLSSIAWNNPARAAEDCRLKLVASFDAIVENGRLMIPVSLNGRVAWVRLDTGAPVSLIGRNLVEELNLPTRKEKNPFIDISGGELDESAVVEKLDLGGMTANNIRFAIVKAEQFNGATIGANLFAAYDIELDMAHSRVNLFLHDHCKGQVVYWTQDYEAIPFKIYRGFHPAFPVTLDGKTLNAMMDTGAGRTYLFTDVAKREFDIDPEADGERPEGRVLSLAGGENLPVHFRQFSALGLGGLEIRNTQIALIPRREPPKPPKRRPRSLSTPSVEIIAEEHPQEEIIVGLSHLQKLRVFIAYGERVLYITPADAQ